jgi:uncharacterized protein (TIGR03118 family)
MIRSDHGGLALYRAAALLLPLGLAPAAYAGSVFYRVHKLVVDQSDGAHVANKPDDEHVDPDLVNPWGIAFNPFGFVWVADNGTGKATLYDGNGVKQAPVVTIPGGKPTGIAFSGSPTDFLETKDHPARFIFATEGGTIAAWNPDDDDTAVTQVPQSSDDPIFKGVAIGANGTAARLFAADFHNAKVVVWDGKFKPVPLSSSAFEDEGIPEGYAPFGIQNLNGDIWITYAKQDANKEDELAGAGFGFVDVFDTNGKLIRRVVTRRGLNAPWALAIAPAGFGVFSNRLLVGNFGDGTIGAYDPATGAFLGRLQRAFGKTLVIDGLWGLAFGNGFQHQPAETLFFAAGPDDEQHGLYGTIKPVP